MITFVTSNSGLTAYVQGNPYMVGLDHPRYEQIKNRLLDLNMSDAEFMALYDIPKEIFKYSNGKVRVEGEQLFYDNIELHNALVTRVIDLLKKQKSVDSLLRFMDNLLQNPSYRAVNELYDFLEACDLPITADGYFLAYKKVRMNYKDIHSGTFDNSVGARPKMLRCQVDEDSERTCSNGLHVCSFGYLAHFGGYESRVMVVKVNPKDVVAVPKDYDNQKMRVSEYEVVGEIPNDQSTRIKDKFSTDDYSESNPKPKSPVGDWMTRDCHDSWDNPSAIEVYHNVTANQAKAAFAADYGVPYTDVRVRKA